MILIIFFFSSSLGSGFLFFSVAAAGAGCDGRETSGVVLVPFLSGPSRYILILMDVIQRGSEKGLCCSNMNPTDKCLSRIAVCERQREKEKEQFKELPKNIT